MLLIKMIDIKNVGRASHLIYKPPENCNFVYKYSEEIIAAIGLVTENSFIISNLPNELFSYDSKLSYQVEIDGEMKAGVITFDNNCRNASDGSFDNKTFRNASVLEEDSVLYIDRKSLPKASEKLCLYIHPDLDDSDQISEKTDLFILSDEFRRNVRRYIKGTKNGKQFGIKIESNGEVCNLPEDEKIQLISSLMLTDFWSIVSHIHDFNHIDKPLIINTTSTGLDKSIVKTIVKKMDPKRQIFIFCGTFGGKEYVCKD